MATSIVPNRKRNFPSFSAPMPTTRTCSLRRCFPSASRRCAVTWRAATQLSLRAAVTSTRFSMCEAAYTEAIALALRDEEIVAQSGLREALQNPDAGTNALIVDFVLHPFDGPFWREHSAQDEKATIPAYLGACWGNYGLHLPGAFSA